MLGCRLLCCMLSRAGPVRPEERWRWRGAVSPCEMRDWVVAPSAPLPHPGAAEGLSFLSAVAGLAVLGFQLAEYGYLPEAVPIEGGVCSNI